MLFNSGTPSLVSYTKLLLSDPTTAPREAFPAADIKQFINRAYLEVRELARQVGDGSGLKITYDDPVADQVDYTMPADFVKIRSVKMELDGKDLSTTAPSGSRVVLLEPNDYTTAFDAWMSQAVVDPTFVGIKDRAMGILAPPAAASVGTNAIQIIYDSSTTELSGDTDEPTIARPHHDLICYIAAVDALASKDQSNQILIARMSQKMEMFVNQASEELWSPEVVASVQGLDDQPDWDGSIGWYR